MTKNIAVSIIIPTYTGSSTIANTFESIIGQETSTKYEIVVVIDGPNQELRERVDRYKKRFRSKGAKFRVHQFASNQGVFEAVLRGVKLASEERVVLVSDRMELSKNYLSTLIESKEEIIIPYIEELSAKNPVSHALSLIRKKIYKNHLQESYRIDSSNFEKVGKGTGGLFINRSLFIEASEAMKNYGPSTHHVSDDTKLFKEVIRRGVSIYRDANLIAYYSPRDSLHGELMHIHRRGPKFVDYYIRPNTRYFLPPIIVVSLVISPSLISWLLISLVFVAIITTVYLSEALIDMLSLIWAIPAIALVFYLGIIKGYIIYLSNAKIFKLP